MASELIRAFEEAIYPCPTYGLSVLAKNKRAQAFYRKNGFEVEKENSSGISYVKTISMIQSRME